MKFVPVSIALTLALAGAPATARADDPTSVKDAYVAFRAAGCKVANIGSPIVARVFRNVPYALEGKIFKSPELSHLFERDGGWYAPRDANADVPAGDRACVRALDAHEKALRKRFAIKPAIEQALTRHPETVLGMHALVQADFRKLRQWQKTRDGVRVWHLDFVAGAMAALALFECQLPEAEARAKAPDWSKLECHHSAAG